MKSAIKRRDHNSPRDRKTPLASDRNDRGFCDEPSHPQSDAVVLGRLAVDRGQWLRGSSILALMYEKSFGAWL
jgi:hypothetical protein